VLRVGQYPGGVQGGFGLFVEVQKHPVSERRIAQALNKGGASTGACAVMQFEICTAMGQALGHAQNRGNPDPAGEQQAAAGIVGQCEQIARLADAQAVAGLDLFVQALRTAP